MGKHHDYVYYSELETAGVVEREREREGERERESRKQLVRDKVAHPVNRSGFHNYRSNS
jgi:hypothetical protein